VREAVGQALDVLGPGPYAVRSSAVVEDSAETSWAGQFDSVLGVPDAAAVPDAVTTCWRSATGERARAYAKLHQLQTGPMAVVVQRMVPGQVSGVVFSRTPEDPERALISAGLGLGEGVVQGQVPCDTFRVDRQGVIEEEVADKDEEMVLSGAETVTRPVTDARRSEPALRQGRILELAEWTFRLEEDLGLPVDVEFTVADGALYLLQVRPVTIPIPVGRRLLWDNSNIVESYSGITTPLTFSFASAAYTIVYQLFCRVMGVDETTIRVNGPTFRRMIGLVRGRVYYNLNAWYRVLALLPGFSFNRSAMETMMGVSEVASDEDAGALPRARWLAGLELARLGARLLWRLAWLERDAARFQRVFDDTLAECKALDLERLGADELLAVYEDIEQKLLWGWTPPLVNDFFCMIFYRMLQKRCQTLTGDDDTQLHNRLLSGEGTLASAAPAIELMDLARLVRDVDALRVLFTGGSSDEVVLQEALRHEPFRSGWESWMDRYGDRSPDELKLESPSLRDTPEYVLGTLRAWARDDQSRVREFGVAEKTAREAAEAEAARLLAGGGVRGVPRRRWFGVVMGQARRRVAMRESLRFERTRIFGFVRLLFRAFGDRFVRGGHLDRREDVFYLTVDEVLGFARGTTATTDLRGLVELRRAEFDRYREISPPGERFYTWGAVHLANRFAGPSSSEEAPRGDEMVGTPCSPGTVTAPARVVRDPRQVPDLEGGILCAHRTDPGWVPLFPTASAVLVERGSLLSHSAVVARELGLPAVVGLRGLLGWVEDGEILGLDGTSGRVWKGGESS
jgi:pyruvate,water dikinase